MKMVENSIMVGYALNAPKLMGTPLSLGQTISSLFVITVVKKYPFASVLWALNIKEEANIEFE